MVRIAAARLTMGSEKFRPEEAPLREVDVAAFWIDRTDVTNQQFAQFVRETGYVTVAERPDPEASGQPSSGHFCLRYRPPARRRLDGCVPHRLPHGAGA